ncbi:unnamed protein product [Pelagomonas calceolata]|uniref:START domain-containing protein n=1 Tax=Pelagomonas calceolata TaxID=35677 RepID=A0A8J2SJ68_9STRA|nr:unnamed protein product [Pelagomonas calceolata]
MRAAALLAVATTTTTTAIDWAAPGASRATLATLEGYPPPTCTCAATLEGSVDDVVDALLDPGTHHTWVSRLDESVVLAKDGAELVADADDAQVVYYRFALPFPCWDRQVSAALYCDRTEGGGARVELRRVSLPPPSEKPQSWRRKPKKRGDRVVGWTTAAAERFGPAWRIIARSRGRRRIDGAETPRHRADAATETSLKFDFQTQVRPLGAAGAAEQGLARAAERREAARRRALGLRDAAGLPRDLRAPAARRGPDARRADARRGPGHPLPAVAHPVGPRPRGPHARGARGDGHGAGRREGAAPRQGAAGGGAGPVRRPAIETAAGAAVARESLPEAAAADDSGGVQFSAVVMGSFFVVW